MLFVTNRTPKQSIRSRLNRKISFPLQNTTVSQNVYFCERHGDDDYIEVGNNAFFQRLKALPAKTQILFYIHGFNNTGEAEVFPNAIHLQTLFNQVAGDNFVYVIPLMWPCDDDSVIAFIDDYWDDQRAADASGMSFARLLGKFDDWRRSEATKSEPCTRRINVLAHSMGNRVLCNAIASWVYNDNGEQMPQLFRNVFMVAADVVNHVLAKDQVGQYICDSARNVVVYYANDDLAMPASKLINLKNRTMSRRLGMTGPEDIRNVDKKVYEVDCDDFNNSFDKPMGHSYFLADKNGTVSPVIHHMVDAIKKGRVVPNKQSHILKKPSIE